MTDNNKNTKVVPVSAAVEEKLVKIGTQIDQIKQAANRAGSTFFNSASANTEVAIHNGKQIAAAKDEVIATKEQAIAEQKATQSPQADHEYSSSVSSKL